MASLGLLAFPSFLSLVVMAFSHLARAHHASLSPAPAPSSDGTAIDQGIAYLLMLVALALTYFLH